MHQVNGLLDIGTDHVLVLFPRQFKLDIEPFAPAVPGYGWDSDWDPLTSGQPYLCPLRRYLKFLQSLAVPPQIHVVSAPGSVDNAVDDHLSVMKKVAMLHRDDKTLRFLASTSNVESIIEIFKEIDESTG